MLSIKFLGGVMVATGAIWWGMCEARRLKLRVDILKGILSGLVQTKNQIEFGRFDIGYIFKKLEVADNGLFKKCSDNISQMGIRSAWESAVCASLCDGVVKDDDKNIIFQLGATLGMSDVRGQINDINMVTKELERVILIAEDEKTRLGKVYRQCGVLLGVFIMIILI